MVEKNAPPAMIISNSFWAMEWNEKQKRRKVEKVGQLGKLLTS